MMRFSMVAVNPQDATVKTVATGLSIISVFAYLEHWYEHPEDGLIVVPWPERVEEVRDANFPEPILKRMLAVSVPPTVETYCIPEEALA